MREGIRSILAVGRATHRMSWLASADGPRSATLGWGERVPRGSGPGLNSDRLQYESRIWS